MKGKPLTFALYYESLHCITLAKKCSEIDGNNHKITDLTKKRALRAEV